MDQPLTHFFSARFVYAPHHNELEKLVCEQEKQPSTREKISYACDLLRVESFVDNTLASGGVS